MHRTSLLLVVVGLVLVAACGSGRDMPIGAVDGGVSDATAPAPVGVPLLGAGAHTADAVEITVIATAAEGVSRPRDLAFNPEAPDQLWLVNLGGSSTVILSGVGTAAPQWSLRDAVGNTHFMARPSAIAFGAPNTFATAQEEDQVTQSDTPPDFMVPTLWSADLSIFDGGLVGHLDMLHNSPNSVGIAWEADNVYWVVDGRHGSLTRYDFQEDHGPGGSDHSDGIIARYAEGQIGYVPGVPSHAELDHATGLLYVADTGNDRIAVLDTATGAHSVAIRPNYDGSEQFIMADAVVTTLVDGAMSGLVQPCGLALIDGRLFITDNATSRIVAYDLDGTELDYLDLSSMAGPGSLMGITDGPDGALYVVDGEQDRVLRVAPLPTR